VFKPQCLCSPLPPQINSENRTMNPVEIVLRSGGGRIKEKDGRE
jgi:hypothetical protein